MPDDTWSRLRRRYIPAPGLLLHDWGDSAAVVFVPGMGSTHLIDGDAASVLAAWSDAALDADAQADADADADADLEPLAAAFEAHVPALLQVGILQVQPAAPIAQPGQ